MFLHRMLGYSPITPYMYTHWSFRISKVIVDLCSLIAPSAHLLWNRWSTVKMITITNMKNLRKINIVCGVVFVGKWIILFLFYNVIQDRSHLRLTSLDIILCASESRISRSVNYVFVLKTRFQVSKKCFENMQSV